MEAIQAEIVSFVAVLIASLLGIITRKLVSYLDSKEINIKSAASKELAIQVTNMIQQSYNHLGGGEKLNVAKSELLRLANEKNIKISEHEMDILIESSVKTMKDAIKKELI